MIYAAGCKPSDRHCWAPRTTPEQRDAAAERVRKGESPTIVARDLGVSASALRDICRVRGVAPRPNGRPKKVKH